MPRGVFRAIIRLTSYGCTNRPFYHLVVTDPKGPIQGPIFEQVNKAINWNIDYTSILYINTLEMAFYGFTLKVTPTRIAICVQLVSSNFRKNSGSF